MKYKLPEPKDFKNSEPEIRTAMAYAKTKNLLIEAIELLELVSETDRYNLDFTQKNIENYLKRIS